MYFRKSLLPKFLPVTVKVSATNLPPALRGGIKGGARYLPAGFRLKQPG